MITMTHDRLRVLGPLEFQSVTMLSFSVQGNEHGRMEIMGYINSDHGLEQLYKDFKGTPVALYGAEEGSDKLLPIFVGKFEQVILHATGGQIIAECVALTYTADLDRQKKSRSFQDVSMTYADVIWSVLGDTPQAGANFTVGEDVSIDRPIIQYEETDWEFIKRLASELKVQLFADCRVPSPQFDLGLPGYQSDYEFSTPNYTCKIDERFYLLGGSQTGQYKPDFLCYIVEDGQSLRVGSSVQWQQTPLFVCGQRAELRKGEFVFTYTLGWRGLVGMRPYRNKKLTGLALGGTVRSTQGEQITLALDIDKGRNVGSFLFPWRPESGNLMYCMPKVGTRAMLYLQDSDAGSAIAINSPRENGQSCGAMADANMRCFTTEHDKKLFMFPDSMGIRGGAFDAPVQIVLDGKSGLLMESAHAVQMIARQGIVISAPTIGASTPQQILLLQSSAATENESLIVPKGTADAEQALSIILDTEVPLGAPPAKAKSKGKGDKTLGPDSGIRKPVPERIETLEQAYGAMSRYLNGTLKDGALLQSAIEFAAKNGKQKTVNQFIPSSGFYGNPRQKELDVEVLAWTNYWNHVVATNPKSSSGQKIYTSSIPIRAEVIKAMLMQENSYAQGASNNSKNSTRDCMTVLFPGDPSLWILADVNPSLPGNTHNNLIWVKDSPKYGGWKEADVYSSNSWSTGKGGEADRYGYGVGGFGILDSVLIEGGEGPGSDKYIVDYTQVTNRMSIALATAKIAADINHTKNSEKEGVAFYGPKGYIDSINKRLDELGAKHLQ